jgi:oxygen-independent coproporphyrinogen-3 oxidase
VAAMNTSQAQSEPVVSPALLRQHDVTGPRYTSYPTADRFVEAFGPAEYETALRGRAVGGKSSAPLSVYVHVPFCESVCYYCACNKVITRHHERATPYLDAIEREIALHVAVIGAGHPVSQLHFGGGTPTFLSDPELERLVAMLESAFSFGATAERSIEVDPRTVDSARLRHLAALRFNRLSLGVQDFDPAVQRAVHRTQSFESVKTLIEAARENGFTSTNLDLIYGLPQQTPVSFARTVGQVCELRPDRIALYAYAHLPQRFKPQRRIDAALLPPAADKVVMLGEAIARFTDSGYAYVGMDHFALHDDPLAVAKVQGRLHRNFQGYSTQPDSDLIGLGVSSIGSIGASYSQNAKNVDEYCDMIGQGQFATVRGLALSRDDVVRRAVVMAVMCQGRVDFESVSLAHLIDAPSYFRAELEALRPLEANGLVTVGPSSLEVTPLGWYFVRAIAMVFDRHLQADRTRDRYSRVL